MANGRPGAARSEASRTAILRAAAALVERVGYDRVTIEGIASEAGVGKQTIYRWYSSKSAVVAECLMEGMLLAEDVPLPTDGRIQDDLTTWLSDVFSFLARDGNAALVGSLLVAAIDDPTITGHMGARLGAAGPTLIDRLERARDSGELAPDASAERIGEAILGSIVVRVLTGAPFVRDDATAVVAMLIHGAAPRAAEGGSA